MEAPHHNVVPTVVAEIVAMTEEEIAPIDGHANRLLMNLDAQFGREIVEHPGIVVTREEVDIDTCVDKFGDLGLEADEASRDDGLVLEPVVEDIAEDVEGLGVGFYCVEPTDYAGLVLPMVGDVWCAEVEVGGEVNLLH